MNKFLLPLLFSISIGCLPIAAQNIAINTSGTAAASTRMLEVTQTSTAANMVAMYAIHNGATTGGNTGYAFQAVKSGASAGANVAGYFSSSGGTGGNYALIVPSGGGNVGIGTSTPSTFLNVSDGPGTDVGPWVTLDGGANVYTNIGLRLWDRGTDLNNENVIEFGHNSTFVAGARIKSLNPAVNATTGGKLYLETTSNNTGTYNTAQLVLSNNGNVGVGLSAPGDKLEVSGGNIKITNGSDYNGEVYSGDANWGFKIQRTAATDDYNVSMRYYPGSGTRKCGIYNGNLGNWPFYLDAGQTPNVIMNNIDQLAIGTSTPNSGWGNKVEVYSGNLTVKNGATNFYTTITGASSSSTGINFRKDGTRHAGFKWDGTYLNLYNTSGDCCNSDSWTGTATTTWDMTTGYMGIAKTPPAYPLTIGQTGNVFGVENTAAFVAKNAGGSYETYLWPRWSDNIMYMNYGSAGYLIRTNSSFNVMFMDNSAQVGVGRTTPDAQFHVNATFKVGDLAVGQRQVLEVVAASGDVTIGSQTQDADVFIRNQAGTNIIHMGANTFPALDVEGGVQIGVNGTTLTKVIKTAVTKDIASVASLGCNVETFTVTNAAVGSSVVVSPSSALTNRLAITYARVSAANTVEVKFCNESGAAIDMGSIDYYITVIE